MSGLVRFTLALHRTVQALRHREVRRRFDDEERAVLADDLTRLRHDRGPAAVLRQWPALLRDGLADAVTTRRVSARDTLARRGVDLATAAVLAIPALLLTTPLAAVVRATSPGPAFVEVTYRGRGGRPLRVRKLRTMTADAPHTVTAFGRVLRAARLDELPTLLALARGDLTLLGPRAQHPASAQPPLEARPGLVPLSSRR